MGAPSRSATLMERGTKLFVVCWACAAFAAEIRLLGGAWLPLSALSAFTLAAVLTTLDRRAIALVLALTYVCPALIYLCAGRHFTLYDDLWMAGLLGGMAPAGVRTGWHIPGPWRGALVCWALVVAVGTSIVVAREVDFTPALIHVTTISNTSRGGWPAFIVRWVLHSALVLVLGILWFDWLFETRAAKVHAAVAGPMAASALGMGAVAIYQLFVNVRFMNPTVYASLGRATGTLFDANVCGTVAALWIGGAALWSNQLGRWRPYATVGGVTVGWLAVWASGSRTAFGAAALVTAFSLVALYIERRDQSARRAFPHVAIAAAGALGLVVLLAYADLGVVGPAARLRATLPEASIESVRGVAGEMWNRNRYGSAATAMIRAFPWFGVGIGSFQTLLPEFAAPLGGRLPPDNAQNWYRHQLAEFGLFGSLAWIAWIVLFAVFVLKGRKDAPAAAWTARGVLVAFALISLVGMPGQEIAVSMTFWTMAFWYVSLVGAPPPAPLRLPAWAAIAAVLVVYAAGTVRAAANELRVPVRAARGGWAYSYGFYPPEKGEGGGEYRWTRQRAVAVIDAPARWMALTIAVNHFKIAGGSSDSGVSRTAPIRAVDVKVWRDRQLVVEKHLTSTAPVTEYVSVPDGEQRLLLETWVSRVIRPRDIGIEDDRELGLLVKWDFQDALPAGASHSASP
jgi:O-antigen ligase